MTKIIEKLLTVIFPTVDVNNLLEIINATPNPEIATEIICGLYVEPSLPQKVQDKETRELTFKLYNKWNGKIEYTYKKDKVLSAYFPKNTVKEDITLENFHIRKVDWNSNKELITITVKTGESITDTASCNSSTWLGYIVITE